MSVNFFRNSRLTAGVISLILSSGLAVAEPQHGIAMYGEPVLPPDFVSLPYVNIDAPKGGVIAAGEVGSFDSLNPFIQKGRVPWQLRFLGVESLMGRNWDEPFSLYGLLAESIEVGRNREWVEFTLRDEARFSDGSPVTVEDVMWSYETLGTKGHGRYRGLWGKIGSMEQTGPNKVKFTFNVEDRELALIVGMRPILKKAQWEGVDFETSRLDQIPITSSPYVVDDYEAGRFVTLKRNPDYWGNNLPFRRGTMNFDEIRMEFFGDETAMFEAFKAGILNTNREFNIEKWRTQYDFPALDAGEVVKSIIPHARPSGMTGFVMNTRREKFKDWRVREAMLHAFNFEYINETVTRSGQPRITSYFSNSALSMQPGEAEGKVKDLLEPFKADLLPGTLEGYELPVSDGSVRNRKGIRKAIALMNEAGFSIQNGIMQDSDGTPFTFEILLRKGSSEDGSIADIFVETLDRMGIEASVQVLDSAAYRGRINEFDFDMTRTRRGASLSPGNEQYKNWSSNAAGAEGSNNLSGMQSKAADAMIGKLVTATNEEELIVAARALDRIIMAGRYYLPFYNFTDGRLAHAKELSYPERIPVYGDWITWQSDVWWWEDK
ncbi:ABC transporter substrate-binding protein [Tropicibacter sp. R15_0]|nr:ABC transporter substrate-binding protein [Tropicibacter sp. R15_0]